MQHKKIISILLLVGVFVTACGPAATPTVAVPPSATLVPSTATAAATLTSTPVPTSTETPIPTETATPSVTPIPTFDPASSEIKGMGRVREDKTFITIDLPTMLGEYYADINGEIYNCSPVERYENRLYCIGKVIPYGVPLVVELHEKSTDAVVLVLESIGYGPDMVGDPNLTCEVEPLWVPPLTGPFGCYAVTCYYRTGGYATGTENSCTTPFPYWLYQTPPSP